ncbi:hypothetical protein [Phaeobacter sp. HF9A]|uniref:hypothetical protein n=1 Tax=Phaeobacter sp. HF9A TaxID=2721561 RepID=UPI001430C06C|nr:hypothetical protein [Phaeobacter sp. HF9A]NIZ12034.1 hypothetical protein [Phaeobacter sp. HF9A]
MLKWIAAQLVGRAEKRIGVELDYARKISQTDIRLFMRYGKIFAFLAPNRNVPPDAYHTARLRGAISADCGTCVEAEINLAQAAGVSGEIINAVLGTSYSDLPDSLRAVAELADAVTAAHTDAADAREKIISAYGEAGLIEICFALNGAALLPGIKRSMGYATVCNLDTLRKLA